MKYAIFIIYFLFQPFVLYGFYNQSELLVNLNYNNNDKTVITRGYWNNAINNNNTTFHLNFIVQEPEYIYNLNHDKHLFNFTTHLYAKYNLELLNTINDISIGFSPTLSSENFLNQFFNIKPIYFGYQSLTKINGNNNDNYYILSNSGLNNNSAFNLSYDISYFEENLHFLFTLTPNMGFSLTNYQPSAYTKNKTLLDIGILYYGETNGIGYGITSSVRQYVQNNAQDFNVIGLFEYFGFTVKIGYLYGNNSILDTTMISNYNISTQEIYYSLLSTQIGFRSSQSQINNGINKYTNNLTEINMVYTLNYNIYINTAIFYETFHIASLKNSVGFIIGAGITI